jgi:hypothetical protein
LLGEFEDMSKLACCFMAAMLGFLLVAAASSKPVDAQADLQASFGSAIADSQIDGDIGPEWSDADKHVGAQELPVSPQGHAEMWVKHDGTYLYIALVFEADSDNPWLSIMFSSADHMTLNTDGALFGHDEYAADGYADISFGGAGVLSKDDSQDGNGAIRIGDSNQVTIELKKSLNSGDSAGKDIAWLQGNTYALTVMWDTNGGGSSGGTVNHYDGTLTGEKILITYGQTPEFPSSILIIATVSIVALVAAMAAATILLKRRKLKKTTKP